MITANIISNDEIEFQGEMFASAAALCRYLTEHGEPTHNFVLLRRNGKGVVVASIAAFLAHPGGWDLRA